MTDLSIWSAQNSFPPPMLAQIVVQNLWRIVHAGWTREPGLYSSFRDTCYLRALRCREQILCIASSFLCDVCGVTERDLAMRELKFNLNLGTCHEDNGPITSTKTVIDQRLRNCRTSRDRQCRQYLGIRRYTMTAGALLPLFH